MKQVTLQYDVAIENYKERALDIISGSIDDKEEHLELQNEFEKNMKVLSNKDNFRKIRSIIIEYFPMFIDEDHYKIIEEDEEDFEIVVKDLDKVLGTIPGNDVTW